MVLQRRRLGGRREHDDGVIHGAVLGQLVDHGGDGRRLLADRDVDADDAFALLIDDRVDGDGSLARLAIADNELALPAADRDHGVDRLDAGLHRLLHRLALHDARRLELDAAADLRFDRALAVDGLAERVHHATEQRFAHRHVGDATGALDDIAFLHARCVTEHGDADVVRLEIQHQPDDATRELDEARRRARLRGRTRARCRHRS